MATQARAGVFSMAVRRVVVTPTFAAGLGVVIAAALAFPMTRTVISYGGTPPVGETPCLVTGCASSAPGSGGLATARPGKLLVPPSPAVRDPAPASIGQGGTTPVMQYQTLRQWQDGFIGEITITDPGGQAAANWQLRLSYGSAHIAGVWGGKWSPRGGHAVLVTPGIVGGPTHGDGNVQVVLVVSGPPGPPSGCAFNGRICRTGQAGGSPGQPGNQQPGNQQGNQQPGNQQGNQQPGNQPAGNR